METIEYNIENEKRLVELLDYYLSGPDANGRCVIWDSDKKNQTYGYIQYKKLHGGQKSKGIPKVFGYYMLINSPKVKCGFTRELRGDNYSNDYDIYKLEITNRSKADVDFVELMLGEHPSIIVRSAKYGYIDFHIDHNGTLYLSFGSLTEKFRLRETINFTNTEDSKCYIYHLEYCNKDHQLSDTNSKWKTARELRGVEENGNRLILNNKTWVHGKIKVNERCTVSGTLEEMIKLHEMGIDAFEHFRYIINQIIPGKEDVLYKIVTKSLIKDYGLSIFLPSDEITEKDNLETISRSSHM